MKHIMNDISMAIETLKSGGVVGMPTETVYGLAASIESPIGIENIFKTKERPFFDPLIVHISSTNQAKKYVKSWPSTCEVLAQNFWPGPLTIVLPKKDNVSDMITSGLDSVGLRMPNHPIALDLINKLGHPIAAPSANKFKKTSPTKKEHVTAEFNDVMVLEGGDCQVGIESTVIGVFEDKISIYRPGMITKADIENVFTKNGITIKIEIVESPVAPGQLKHHYMPKLPIILLQNARSLDEVNHEHIDSKALEKPSYLKLENDPSLCARNLYHNFRKFDDNASSIVIPLSDNQLNNDQWLGIMNRLEKAASYTLSK